MRQFVGKLILGRDARTRVRLKRSLAAAAVGMVGLVIQHASVAAGMTKHFWATAVSVFAVASLAVAMGSMAITQPAIFKQRLEAFHFLLAALVLPVIAALAGQLSDIRHKHRIQKARLLGAHLRIGDGLARWGGEEFLLMLPATSIEEALMAVDRLRVSCADAALYLAKNGGRNCVKIHAA